ncbi:dipeptidase [Bacteroidota bacterium]
MENISSYIEQNKNEFLNELFELIRIPSISSDSKYKQDVIKAAEYWREILLKSGAEKSVILGTKGNPVVYGEKIIDNNKPTVMVYGHYDVMPVDPVDEWKSSPFEPEIRNDKIYARGADDDKGQAFIQAKAFEYLVKNNLLKCNVKFLIEGEEEIGSPSLEEFCAENLELLKSDIILVSDTSMFAPDIPSITTGLRGLSYIEVEVKGPDIDLHSGVYGGGVPNPANILAKMIASLKNENHIIQIPGFYDDVINLDQKEREEINKAPFNLDEYKKSIGINDIEGEKGYTTIERVGIRPSLDVNGIWGGYTGEGAKTVIPSKATAKISMRLVPDQDNVKISKLVKDHLLKIAPPSVKVNIKVLHGGQSYVSPLDNKAYIAAGKAINEVFGKFPIPEKSGGSIPIIATFEKVLGTKSILLGFGLESDAIHSPNENFSLSQFYKGIETVAWFYQYFCE